MSTTFDLKTAFRGTLVLSLVASAHAVSGCGSNSTTTAGTAVDSGFYPPLGTGGVFTGQGGGGADLGAGGGTINTGGAGGGTNPDASLGNGGSAGTAGAGGGGARTDGAAADAPACIVPQPSQFIPTTGFTDCKVPTLPNCTNGKCVPTGAVPVASQSILADCDAMDKCVPTYFVERAAKFIAPSCTSLKNAEGRCLSQCIPQIAQQASFLPLDTCTAGDLCAPCYDPRTGKDTGACTQGCDKGPTKPAVVFDKCCKGIGSCVPTSAIPPASVSLLGKDTCTTAGELCAPDKLTDPTVKPKVCVSLKNAEGRCLADCIPAVAAQASRLPSAGCDPNELCTPCFDPFSGAPTGACTQNGDKPTNTTPVTFPGCCTALGHCIPTSILTTDQKTLLGADSCTGGDLCAPDVFAVSGKTADTCRALGALNAEGRCIPACVPSIQAQKDKLSQATCGTGMLCAPCYDPLSGADTGACTQNGDTAKETKKLFPTCCGGLGACVPPALVPTAQQSQLGPDVCTDTTNLCAPKALADATVKPKACTAPGGFEARCLPACLPPIKAQASNLRQVTCATGELCADCYNPIDGTDTQACRINGDAPTQAKKVFAGCCPYPATNGTSRGKCVPPELVSASQATSLPQDSCATGSLCAPNLKVTNQSAKFPTCHVPAGLACPFPSPTGCNGACVPDCIVTDAVQKAVVTQGTCQPGELCAPCNNPLPPGASTGACD
jgi:hypothetical protein